MNIKKVMAVQTDVPKAEAAASRYPNWIRSDIPEDALERLNDLGALEANPFDPVNEMDRFAIVTELLDQWLQLPEAQLDRESRTIHRDYSRETIVFPDAVKQSVRKSLEKTLSKEVLVGAGSSGQVGRIHVDTSPMKRSHLSMSHRPEVYKHGFTSPREVLIQIAMANTVANVPEITAAGSLKKKGPMVTTMQAVHGWDVIDLSVLLYNAMLDGKIDEETYNRVAGMMIYDVMLALRVLNSQAIAHKDVNPNNIRFGYIGDPQSGSRILHAWLLDFGLAEPKVEGAVSYGIGTPEWMAPEALRAATKVILDQNPGFMVVQDFYNRVSASHEAPTIKVDSFGLGITLSYFMGISAPPDLNEVGSGLPPAHQWAYRTVQACCNAEYFLFNPHHVSFEPDNVKSLIEGLMEKDPKKRLTPNAALSHPFVEKYRPKSQSDRQELANILEEALKEA